MMSQILPLSDGMTAHALLQGAGSPVVLIHGVGMQAQTWTPQIAALAAHHRVIAVDMPGHGRSDPLPEQAGLPAFVAWAADVITALNLGPVSLVGHSMGALITLGLTVERPDLVARAALLNAVYLRDPAASAAVRKRAAEISMQLGGIEHTLDRWFRASETALRDKVAGWLQAMSPQGYATAYRAFALGDAVYADRLPQVTCPLLVMTSDGDANSTPAMTETMASIAPCARAVVIAGHRHMVTLTAPHIVNTELLRWLDIKETAL